MMKNTVLCSLVVTAVTLSSAQALTFKGTIYPLNSDRTKPAMKIVIVEDATATRTIVTTADASAITTYRDEALFEEGSLKKYFVDHGPAQEKGFIEIEDKKILFTYTKDGKTKTATENLTDNFVVGSTLRPYIKQHWAELLKGETLSIRIGVLDRLETVGFKIFKTGETEKDGKIEVELKMKPTSIIIAALVDPLLFYLDKKTVRFNSIKGRSMSKLKVNGEWKPFDGETIYTYE